MGAHQHDPSASSQNLGNFIGTRSCIRQSKLFRQYESGNSMKALLGQPNLAWQTDEKEGAYRGQPVWDANVAGPTKCAEPAPANQQSKHSRNHDHDQSAKSDKDSKDNSIGAGCWQAVQAVQSRPAPSTRPW